MLNLEFFLVSLLVILVFIFNNVVLVFVVFFIIFLVVNFWMLKLKYVILYNLSIKFLKLFNGEKDK